MNDGPQMYFFGSNQRKPILEVKTHLVAEYAERACSGTVMFLSAVIQHMFH